LILNEIKLTEIGRSACGGRKKRSEGGREEQKGKRNEPHFHLVTRFLRADVDGWDL